MELDFSIVAGGWIGQLELLDCEPVTLGNKVQFCKYFFKIFEILEHTFCSESFKKIICSGGFSPVVGCRQYGCNCNKRELYYKRFFVFLPKFLV